MPRRAGVAGEVVGAISVREGRALTTDSKAWMEVSEAGTSKDPVGEVVEWVVDFLAVVEWVVWE